MAESRIALDPSGNKSVTVEYIIRDPEKTTRQENRSIHSRSNLNMDGFLTLSGEQIYDPAAKLLVASIKWLHGVPSFTQLKSSEQLPLVHQNWRELFLIAAAQYSYYFDEGTYAILSGQIP